MSITIYLQYLIAMQYLNLPPCGIDQFWAEIQKYTSRDANPFDELSDVDYVTFADKVREDPRALKWECYPYDFTLTDDTQRYAVETNHSTTCRCSACAQKARAGE